MARDPRLCARVRGIFVRAVWSFYQRRARDAGDRGGRAGAVVCTQRFDSALRLDVHFHALVLDGIYTGFGSRESPTPGPNLCAGRFSSAYSPAPAAHDGECSLQSVTRPRFDVA